ncbi:MAG: tRNA (N6-threonylcarbamoyladenosine(37)-N6)-methyltransferase TrmO [Desulfobacterales bacterium]
MDVIFTPIGIVRTSASNIPRHWSLSDVKGTLEIDPNYSKGLKDIRFGQKIVVLFYFHQSPPFSENLLVQTPPHRNKAMGIFSICSPRRPNPIGLSVVEVTAIRENRLDVQGIDMFDGTPILDIKPHISSKQDCPSCQRY